MMTKMEEEGVEYRIVFQKLIWFRPLHLMNEAYVDLVYHQVAAKLLYSTQLRYDQCYVP